MVYILHRYDTKPYIEEDHVEKKGMATEDRPLSRVIEEITRTYRKPVLLTWYTIEGELEYHIIKKE